MDTYQYKLGTRHKTLWGQEIHCTRFASLFPIQHVVLGHIESSSFPRSRYVQKLFFNPLGSTHLSSHMSTRPFFARMPPTTEELHKLELWRSPGQRWIPKHKDHLQKQLITHCSDNNHRHEHIIVASPLRARLFQLAPAGEKNIKCPCSTMPLQQSQYNTQP